MSNYLTAYEKAIFTALDNRDKHTRGKKLIIYAGYHDFHKILKYGEQDGHLNNKDRIWFFLGCELIEVRKEDYFQIAFEGYF